MELRLKSWVIAYIAAAVVFFAMDAVWLTLTNEAIYRRYLGEILLDGFRLGPAVAFYALYLFGLLYFAIAPALKSGSAGAAALNGALLGLVSYGTYDLTNQATLKIWSMNVTLLDLAWGMFVSACGAAASYKITKAIG